jgi:hypothetical protein
MSTQPAGGGDVMQVTPENVLQARAVLLAEAESFQGFIRDNFSGNRRLVGLCGGDPISQDAQELFTEKIQENAVRPAQQYVQRLLDLADQLAVTARSFGITEQRIADSFRPDADPGHRA